MLLESKANDLVNNFDGRGELLHVHLTSWKQTLVNSFTSS